MPDSAGDKLLEKKQEIQEAEYALPYHYKDVFAEGQSVERNSIFKFAVEAFCRAGKKHVIDVGCGDGTFRQKTPPTETFQTLHGSITAKDVGTVFRRGNHFRPQQGE